MVAMRPSASVRTRNSTRLERSLSSIPCSVRTTLAEDTSLLLKGGLRLPDNQTLRFNYMHTDMAFGEAMQYLVQKAMNDGDETSFYQLPHSNVDQKNYGINYSWQSSTTPWIKLDLGVWRTTNHSERHQNGDWPWGVLGPDRGDSSRHGDQAWDQYTRCHILHLNTDCSAVSSIPPERELGDFSIIPLALMVSKHTRQGANISNVFTLSSSFSLFISGDFQEEELSQADAYDNKTSKYNKDGRTMGPRAGRRAQHGLSINLEWAPTSWLTVNAGTRYSSYWSFDDGLDRYRTDRTGLGGYGSQDKIVTHKAVPYLHLLSDNEVQLLHDYNNRETNYQNGNINYQQMAEIGLRYNARQRELNATNTTQINSLHYWNASVHVPYLYEKHHGFIANDPFLNGSMSFDDTVENPQGQQGSHAKYLLPISGGPTNVTQPVPVIDRWAPIEKHKGDGWAPSFSLTAWITSDIRLYARYSEAIRFPSIYEDTQSTNAYGVTLESTSQVQPERSENWEVGYVHDLTKYFYEFRYVDVKINYFYNRIHNFIDRDDNFNIIVQFDKKEFSGIEFQSRWDTGLWYANFATTYRLNPKVCDADYAAANFDPYFNTSMDTCVMAGFPQTNARISLQPKYSIDLSLGLRLLNDRLELGGRMVYHSEAKNKSEIKWLSEGNIHWSNTLTKPFYWNAIQTFDAYASYRVNNSISLNAGINNITNEYYLDPLARTTLPAPGRTFKLGLTIGL